LWPVDDVQVRFELPPVVVGERREHGVLLELQADDGAFRVIRQAVHSTTAVFRNLDRGQRRKATPAIIVKTQMTRRTAMSQAIASPATTTTADDTLKAKSRDAGVISGGHLVARALKNEGVDTIFTLCGGHIIDIYDGCVDEGIRIVDVRHEQVAAHAADGYARQTGKLGCVVTTAGPGCTNAVTGIATAFRSESPVLHIGGQGAMTQHMMGSLQDLPHVT
jgi:hypothetical protein